MDVIVYESHTTILNRILTNKKSSFGLKCLEISKNIPSFADQILKQILKYENG